MSKQRADMIQFSLQNSTKTYCPFRISSPAETPQCYKWLSYIYTPCNLTLKDS